MRSSRSVSASGGGTCDERPDDGLPADDPAAPPARRAVLPGQADCDAAAGQELPPLQLSRDVAAREAARGGALEARPPARRPRGNAVLEPLPTPRGVLRHPVRRLRPAHAEPPLAPERP